MTHANGTTLNNIDQVLNDTISASADYFRNHVLKISSGIDNPGTVRWEFALILLFAWIIIYFSVFKGTKSVGKVVYVTVLFPYIVLMVFIIRGFTLPGSYEGIVFFFKPRWHRLANPKVWVHAAATNFFSLGIGAGGNITLASFNKHEGKILRLTLIIAAVDLFTSLMASVAIFSNLGYLAQHQGKNIDEVVNSGTELVFIVFPEIFTTMPLSQLFSILFFLMIITLVIDTLLVGPEIVVTALTDRFKTLPRREVLYGIVCLLFYFLAFPTITQGGIYYFSLIDFYVSFGSGVSLAFLETVAISWIYGAKNVAKDISEMTGTAPSCIFVICWYFICPLLIIAIWIFSIVKYRPYTFGSYLYPTWAVGIAWTIAMIPLTCVPVGMVHSLYKSNGKTLREKIRSSIKPKMSRRKGHLEQHPKETSVFITKDL